MQLPHDYAERVYAGVLGKIIGVYLGRPFEGWRYEQIVSQLGEVNYYVHEKLGKPLIVTDDDISGTFTFLRALPDHDCSPDLTPAQIGWTWRNYLIENRTVLWWGGLGLSTEHTAFLRLKAGIEAPASGSIAVNGKVVAEQIGAQIFIDGWAMVAPGDPERAVDLARRAASVSHDGEAIYGAQVVAAMEAQAFVERDLNRLLDTAYGLIPADSIVAALIRDLREWRQSEPDWRAAREKVEERYGYHIYGGNCHMIPNHAVILLALLYGDDDFQRSLMIANTAGWDTDCNSGNVGCLMGIKNGLAGIDAGPDWRGPVADRMYLPTADGGRAVTDAVRETFEIVDIGRRLAGQEPLAPKGGARFHFSLPDSVQGFRCEDSVESRGAVSASNRDGRLALDYRGVAPGRVGRVSTATFLTPEAASMGGYGLICSPTLYPGQTVAAQVAADAGNARPVDAALYVRVYGRGNALEILRGEVRPVAPGEIAELTYTVPDTVGRPVAEVGIEIGGASGDGALMVDWLSWDGVPTVSFAPPQGGGDLWKRAWVNAADHFDNGWSAEGLDYRVIQDAGTGLVTQGEASWRDYVLRADVYPHMADAVGVVVAYRGLTRYVALLLGEDGVARLVERHDADETVLAEARILWELDTKYPVTVTTRATGEIVAAIAGGPTLEASIAPERAHGAIGMLAREGHGQFGGVRVEPA